MDLLDGLSTDQLMRAGFQIDNTHRQASQGPEARRLCGSCGFWWKLTARTPATGGKRLCKKCFRALQKTREVNKPK